MLALTEDAVSAVNAMITNAELPDGSGLRISHGPGESENADEPAVTLELNLVPSPQEGDQIIGEEPVFVEAAVADALDDKLLDAEIVENKVRFVVSHRA